MILKSIHMKNISLYFSLFLLILISSCGESSSTQEETREPAAETASEEIAEVENDEPVILFFGNSLTAGMGLEPDEAFPAVIQEKLDSLGLSYQVVNAGLSGETTASGKNRVEWVLDQEVDIFVLELGANDGLRGVPVEETRRNLQAIIDKVRSKNPEIEIILTGMQIPPNLGPEYTSEFRSIFPELAEKNNIHLVPFLLEDVAGRAELNQADGIHPTAEGQEILAENVWEVLEPVVKKDAE